MSFACKYMSHVMEYHLDSEMAYDGSCVVDSALHLYFLPLYLVFGCLGQFGFICCGMALTDQLFHLTFSTACV